MTDDDAKTPKKKKKNEGNKTAPYFGYKIFWKFLHFYCIFLS